MTPKFELGRDNLYSEAIPKVSSFYIYSFTSYRVDKQTRKQTNIRRWKHPTLFSTLRRWLKWYNKWDKMIRTRAQQYSYRSWLYCCARVRVISSYFSSCKEVLRAQASPTSTELRHLSPADNLLSSLLHVTWSTRQRHFLSTDAVSTNQSLDHRTTMMTKIITRKWRHSAAVTMTTTTTRITATERPWDRAFATRGRQNLRRHHRDVDPRIGDRATDSSRTFQGRCRRRQRRPGHCRGTGRCLLRGASMSNGDDRLVRWPRRLHPPPGVATTPTRRPPPGQHRPSPIRFTLCRRSCALSPPPPPFCSPVRMSFCHFR